MQYFNLACNLQYILILYTSVILYYILTRFLRPREAIPSPNLGQKLKSKKVEDHGLRYLKKHCQDGFRRLNKFKFEVKILEQHSFGGLQSRFLAQI